jgi:dTDP-4-amino-4,6-dideoxygalactose transaminase
MQDNGIAVRRYYTANHELKYYSGRYRQQDLEYTDFIKNRIVSLPIHTVMNDEEFTKMFDTISDYFHL